MSASQKRFGFVDISRRWLTSTGFQIFGLASILILITWIVYLPVLSADFVHLDDKVLVTENIKIRDLSLANTWKYFTSYHEFLYHPLVTLSYAIEYHFAALNPQIYHATNLFLHILNTLLVFGLFIILTGKRFIAFATALLFAIHPMHVESVAWVSGRKDTLYAIFFLGSLLSYALYIVNRRQLFYGISLFLFTCSLFSKSMAISLPFILSAMYWISGREIKKTEVYRGAPFLLLSIVFAIVTFAGYYEVKTLNPTDSQGIWGRIYASSQNYVFYLLKMIIPTSLSAMYPKPVELGNVPSIIFYLSPLILGVLSLGVYFLAKKSTAILGGVIFFVIALGPVSQIIPVGLGTPADRYTYIPFVGLFFVIAVGIRHLAGRLNIRYAGLSAFVLLGILSVPFAVSANQRTKVWQSTLTLSEDMLRHYELPPQYYNNGGAASFIDMETSIALKYFSKSIDLEPDNKMGWYHRGLVYFKAGEFRQAIADFNSAIKLDDRFFHALNSRGNAYVQLGDTESAIRDYTIAISIQPKNPIPYANRGRAYYKQGKDKPGNDDLENAKSLGFLGGE